MISIIILETKLDEFFPMSQFLDRTSSGGGITLYIREGIPFKLLKSNGFSVNTEAFLVEVKIIKKKWLICCSCNPNKALIKNHINELEKTLDIYLHKK